VNRAFSSSGDLNVHQTPGDLSFWLHNNTVYTQQFGPGRYPTSIASGGGLFNGPHITFVYISGGSSFQAGAQFESGGWYSSFWDDPIDIGPGIASCYRIIGKQLPTGDILFILLSINSILYSVWTYDFSTQIAWDTLASQKQYWGWDINGDTAYIFYYDSLTLDVYYKTTSDGVNWSSEQTYNMIWPNPYTNNRITWTQMALTDSGNSLLVFDNSNADDSTYPFYSKVYVSYASGQSCVEVSSTFGAPDTECFYPTIATGGNYAAVLYCMPRNNENDSLNWWDFYVVLSTNNGITWGTPNKYTHPLTSRSGLPQLAKRIDATRSRVYFVYAVDMIENHDPLWHCWFDPQGLDPMYVCFDYSHFVDIEESDKSNAKNAWCRLEVMPNPFARMVKVLIGIERNTLSKETNTHATTNSVRNLRIYDISGRIVKDLSMQLSTDNQQMQMIIWRGDDDEGQKAPPGVYWIRAENRDNHFVTSKLIKLP
jgi:hypothetical protein